MTWVRTEATERKHPKLQSVPVAVYGFHHAARGWAAENRTNGFIPSAALGYIYRSVTAKVALKYVEILVAATDPARPDSAPLWETAEGGWWIHDFLEYNESASEIAAKQTADRRRQRARRHRQIYGDGHDCQASGCHTVTPSGVTGGVTPVVTPSSHRDPRPPIRTDPIRSDPTRTEPTRSDPVRTGEESPGDGSRHEGSTNQDNGPVELTADELKGLPLIAQARRITVAQAKSELVAAKLREREGKG